MINNTHYSVKFFSTATVGILLLLQSCGRVNATNGGTSFVNDPDSDGVQSIYDNCPNVANGAQADNDNNGIGDACDQAGPSGSQGTQGTAFANAVIVSINKQANSCNRVIVWEDLSNNETAFIIRVEYEEEEYNSYYDEWETYYRERDISIPSDNPNLSETRTYIDNTLDQESQNIRYQIVTQFQDGSEQSTPWENIYDGC